MSVRPIKKCVHRLKMSIVCPQNDFHPFNISDSHNNHLYHARFLYGCPTPLRMTWTPDTCLGQSKNKTRLPSFSLLPRQADMIAQSILLIKTKPRRRTEDHQCLCVTTHPASSSVNVLRKFKAGFSHAF